MWQAYLYFYSLLVAVGIILSVFNHNQSGILVIPDFVVSVITCIGIYSYTFRKTFWTKSFWQKVLFTTLGIDVIETLSHYTDNPLIHTLYTYNLGGSLLADSISYLLLLPSFYALYRLAYKELPPIVTRKKKPYSELAIVSFVLSLFGLFVPVILTFPAAILGIFALQRIAKEKKRGSALAWIGIGVFMVQALIASIFVGYIFVKVSLSAKQQNDETAANNTAIEKMNKEELHFMHANLDKISADSTLHDVVLLLGEPNAVINLEEDGRQYIYACPEAQETDNCMIRVNFFGNTAYKIIWQYEGKFSYTKDLHKAAKTI